MGPTVNVETLIQKTLDAIWQEHYKPLVNQFHRDKRALIKCVARYGYLCQQRNWHVEPDFILREILTVLQRAKKQKADIEYLPSYLHVALTRAVGQRSEEIAQEAQSNIGRRTAKIIKEAGIVTAVIQPTAVELLAVMYDNLKPKRKSKAPKTKQRELL